MFSQLHPRPFFSPPFALIADSSENEARKRLLSGGTGGGAVVDQRLFLISHKNVGGILSAF